jgi:hypothetical protein
MRTRVFIICVILCQAAFSLFAQNKNDRFHLFGSERKGHRNTYFGPVLAISNVEGHMAVDAGLTAGVAINNKFFIGLYGQKLISNVPRMNLEAIGYPSYTGGLVNMIHAGGVLGYIHKTQKVYNWGLSGSAGIGRLQVRAKPPSSNFEDAIYDDMVIILTPKVFTEVNMTSWFKINVSAGYRLVGKVNSYYMNSAQEKIPIFDKSDYIKPEFSIALLFGSFGFHSIVIK